MRFIHTELQKAYLVNLNILVENVVIGKNSRCCNWLVAHDLIPSLFSSFLGNVHVYRNGRMHFAHHNRQERREQQRDVSVICNTYIYLCILYQLYVCIS